MGFEHRAFRRTGLVQDRREQMLRHRLTFGGSHEVSVVEHPLVCDVLVDEAKTARRVDEDVTHPILPDHAALEIAEARNRFHYGGGCGCGLPRRLHYGLALEQRSEFSHCRSRIVETLRRE